MNTDIVSIDAIIIDELTEEIADPVINEFNDPLHETPLPGRRFGIVDLWKIRSTGRPFRIYR
jgi:hypothetical protein